jgi:hypothetical protein
MLYPQFEDYCAGRIGILDPPLRLVHFAGAILRYRMFCDRVNQPVIDENFRLLFLALMEDLFPAFSGIRLLPSTSMLARGLDDPAAVVTYVSPLATREYPTFRSMIEDLCNSPIFQGPRAEQIRASLSPFDRHYKDRLAATKLSAYNHFDAIELDAPTSKLAGQRLQFLIEIVPRLSRLAVLLNPSNPSHGQALQQIQTAAQALGIELHVARASTPDKFEGAFATIIAGRAEALVVLADGMFFDNHPRILAFTDVCRLPTLFPKKEITEAGGLMSYSPNVLDGLVNLSANAVDQPTELPTRFELAINIKTAKVLGLAVPSTLLAIADRIVE